MLTWGNVIYHGSTKMGSTDSYPMNAMMFRLYEETVDQLIVGVASAKDRYVLRSLPFIRTGCVDASKTCTVASAYIRAMEDQLEGPKDVAHWTMGSKKTNDMEATMPDYVQSSVLTFLLRLYPVLHPDRVPFGRDLWTGLFKMLAPLMEMNKVEQEAILNEYVPALARAKVRCFSLGKHTCFDSMIVSRLQEFFALLAKFPMALYWQEERVGIDHFTEVGLPVGKARCENIPHAMWHRKSAEFLATMTFTTMKFDETTSTQCKDKAANAGNLFGAKSLVEALQSPVIREGIATLLTLPGLGGKIEMNTGVAGLDAFLKEVKGEAGKLVGSSSLKPVYAAVETAQKALRRQGQCTVTFGNMEAAAATATSKCACGQITPVKAKGEVSVGGFDEANSPLKTLPHYAQPATVPVFTMPVLPVGKGHCCKGFVARCLACAEGKTEEAFCAGKPETIGCDATHRLSPSPDAPEHIDMHNSCDGKKPMTNCTVCAPVSFPGHSKYCVEPEEARCEPNFRSGVLHCMPTPLGTGLETFHMTSKGLPDRMVESVQTLEAMDKRLAQHEQDVMLGEQPFVDEYVYHGVVVGRVGGGGGFSFAKSDFSAPPSSCSAISNARRVSSILVHYVTTPSCYWRDSHTHTLTIIHQHHTPTGTVVCSGLRSFSQSRKPTRRQQQNGRWTSCSKR